MLQAYSEDEGLPNKRSRKSKQEGGKSRKKRSRDEVDSGDEEVANAGYEAKKPREAAKTAEQIRLEMIEREASREEAKAILKAIMLMASGTCRLLFIL